MALMSNITKGGAVKSMSLVETVGAGLIGGVANGLMSGFMGNFPAWVKPVAEVAGGMIIGKIVGGSVGNMIQNGLVISGMANVSEFIAQTGKALIAGNQQAQPATSGNMY